MSRLISIDVFLKQRRPGIVMFINRISVVANECKRPDLDDAIEHRMSQHFRNHSADEIPHYVQTLGSKRFKLQ